MLLFHTTLEEHISKLQTMLQTIRKFGLTIRLSKTFIAYKEVIGGAEEGYNARIYHALADFGQ